MRSVLVFIASPPSRPTFTGFRRFQTRIAPLNGLGNDNMRGREQGSPTLKRSDGWDYQNSFISGLQKQRVSFCAIPFPVAIITAYSGSERDENWPVLSNPGAEAVDRAERGAAHLRGAGADPLCRGARVRQRLVFRAPFPPGVVAQQRPRPAPGGGEPAPQPHPA